MTIQDLMLKYRTKTICTSGVKNAMKESTKFGNDVLTSIMRFAYNDDFGDLCEEDILANKLAINSGLENDRVVAKYNTCKDPIYIIAEKYSDSEIVVTILFTHEY